MSARILVGDCMALMGSMDPDSVDAIVTDPPYGTGHSRRTKRGHGDWRYDRLRETWDTWDMGWLPRALRVARGPVVFFCPAARLDQAIMFANDNALPWRLLVWCKTNARPSFSSDVAWAMEPIIALRPLTKCAEQDWFADTLPHSGPEPTGHPHQKPIAVMQWLVRLACPVGGCILDPYAGSGTTGVAAVGTGRSAVLIEQDEQWAHVTRQRLSNHAPLFAEGAA